MRFLCFLAVLAVGTPALAAKAGKSPKKQDAQEAYRAGNFARAIELFSAALTTLPASDRGTPAERDLRERLVLSLYAGKQEQSALEEYKELKRRFPEFSFDEDRVSPDTVRFFAATPSVKAAPATEPVASAPVALAPRELAPAASMEVAAAPAKKPWRWYYLAPLGIGQFLAGSPVRGALLLVLELGLVAMNVVGYALLRPLVRPDGTVPNLAQAQPLQVITNVGFFGWIGALALGVIDGALLEP